MGSLLAPCRLHKIGNRVVDLADAADTRRLILDKSRTAPMTANKEPIGTYKENHEHPEIDVLHYMAFWRL